MLPGVSSARLTIRGNIVMLLAGCLVFPLAFESSFKSVEDLYAGTILGVAGVGLILGLGTILWGSRKQNLEIQQGYTTKVSIGIKHPELFLVDHKSLVVVSRPREPRPGGPPTR